MLNLYKIGFTVEIMKQWDAYKDVCMNDIINVPNIYKYFILFKLSKLRRSMIVYDRYVYNIRLMTIQ